MHRNYNPCLVALPYINRMAASLAPKHEAQSLGDAHKIFRCGRGQLRCHAGISIGLIKMSSVGMGNPSSTRLSIYSSMASRMLVTPSSFQYAHDTIRPPPRGPRDSSLDRAPSSIVIPSVASDLLCLRVAFIAPRHPPAQ